ncbi:MAG: hypothetical protein QM703_12415 [Gemmatales bacterium]
MEIQSKEVVSPDPGVTSPNSNRDNFSRPPEFNDPAYRKAWRKETVDLVSGAALILSIPGPLLVLIAYLLPDLPSIRDAVLALFLGGFYFGLIFNAIALVTGLCSLLRWQGFVAVVVSIGWWCWVYWALTSYDWAI